MQNGPIISTVFDACYDKSVIEVVNVQNGDLITSRNDPAFNGAFAWGTRVSLVYQGETVQGLQNGATVSNSVEEGNVDNVNEDYECGVIGTGEQVERRKRQKNDGLDYRGF